MNYWFQRRQVKPTAKDCEWCKHLCRCFEEEFDIEVEKCELENHNTYPKMTHRLTLKMIREDEFRYCKNYRYSKVNFKRFKNK